MAVVDKVYKQGLQHHAVSHITMHLYISSCKLNLWKSTGATYVGMHGYVDGAWWCILYMRDGICGRMTDYEN